MNIEFSFSFAALVVLVSLPFTAFAGNGDTKEILVKTGTQAVQTPTLPCSAVNFDGGDSADGILGFSTFSYVQCSGYQRVIYRASDCSNWTGNCQWTEASRNAESNVLEIVMDGGYQFLPDPNGRFSPDARYVRQQCMNRRTQVTASMKALDQTKCKGQSMESTDRGVRLVPIYVEDQPLNDAGDLIHYVD